MVLILIVIFLAATELHAQSLASRGELFGGAGWARFLDDEGSLGDGVNLGGGVGIRPFRKVGFEFEVNGFHHVRDFDSGVRFDGTAVLATGNLVYHFTDSDVQPYFIAGAGWLHSNRTSRFPVFRGPEQIFKFRDDRYAYDVGIGFKIFVSEKFSLRPEFRLFIATEGFSAVRVSMGAGYHW